MLNLMYFALIAVVILEYLLVLISFSRRNNKIPDDLSLEGAFELLSATVKRAYPSLPEGLTWKETMDQIRGSSPVFQRLDWDEIENTLSEYEAFRYGGNSYPKVELRNLVRLVRLLERRNGFAS